MTLIWNYLSFSKLFEIWKSDELWQMNNPRTHIGWHDIFSATPWSRYWAKLKLETLVTLFFVWFFPLKYNNIVEIWRQHQYKWKMRIGFRFFYDSITAQKYLPPPDFYNTQRDKNVKIHIVLSISWGYICYAWRYIFFKTLKNLICTFLVQCKNG